MLFRVTVQVGAVPYRCKSRLWYVCFDLDTLLGEVLNSDEERFLQAASSALVWSFILSPTGSPNSPPALLSFVYT